MMKFRDISMNKKLYCMIFLCLIVPLILIFCFMNGVIGKKLREDQCEKELEILKQSKPVIENVLNDVEMISRNILGNDDTQALLEYYRETGGYEETAGVNLNFYLRDLMSAREYLSSISIYTEDRILFQCGNFFSREYAADDRELRKRLDEREGGAVWEPAKILPYYIAGDENEYVVSLQRNINSMHKLGMMGTERISIKEEYLCSLYRTGERAGENRMYIYDADGSIVSASDKHMLGTRVREEIVESAAWENGFFPDHSENMVALYYRIPLNHWVVVKELPLEDMDEQILRSNAIIWSCLLLTLLFGGFFSVLQKKSVVNPIIKLSQAVSRIEGDDFKIELYTSSKDEVGTLNQDIIKMTGRLSELIDKVYKSKIQMREAEILSLQSQINPHFLYNTLDTLRWIALEHQEREIAKQIEALSDLFRHVLNNGNEITTVKEEVEHLQSYLLIQQSRFGERILVALHVSEDLYPCKVLKLILQPLVENAFVHGLEKKVGKGEIRISIDETENRIRYTVEDNGLGTDEERINAMLNSSEEEGAQEILALRNIRNRIKLKYGEGYGLQFHSTPGLGTKVTVWIPRIGEEENEGTDSR